jgi:hypothetical protein
MRQIAICRKLFFKRIISHAQKVKMKSRNPRHDEYHALAELHPQQIPGLTLNKQGSTATSGSHS